MVDTSFEEAMKPVWAKVRQMGLSEEDINALIVEARAKSVSYHKRLKYGFLDCL